MEFADFDDDDDEIGTKSTAFGDDGIGSTLQTVTAIHSGRFYRLCWRRQWNRDISNSNNNE